MAQHWLRSKYRISFIPEKLYMAPCTWPPFNWIKYFLWLSQLANARACDFRSVCLPLFFQWNDRFWLRGGEVTSFLLYYSTGFLTLSTAHIKQSTTTPEIFLPKLKMHSRQHFECILFVFCCFFSLLNSIAGHRKKINIVRKSYVRVKNKSNQKNLTSRLFRRYY